jgi:methyl-accepting chemotaxis protein
LGFYGLNRRLVTGPLNRAMTHIRESSDHTALASREISATSHSLAEGASEQAASLQETSASLEEMSSMTQRNAEHAQRANTLARQTRQAADTGSAEMQEMTQAMGAIKASGDNIARIIKTINEIAFQTNLLALNAAWKPPAPAKPAWGSPL